MDEQSRPSWQSEPRGPISPVNLGVFITGSGLALQWAITTWVSQRGMRLLSDGMQSVGFYGMVATLSQIAIYAGAVLFTGGILINYWKSFGS